MMLNVCEVNSICETFFDHFNSKMVVNINMLNIGFGFSIHIMFHLLFYVSHFPFVTVLSVFDHTLDYQSYMICWSAVILFYPFFLVLRIGFLIPILTYK